MPSNHSYDELTRSSSYIGIERKVRLHEWLTLVQIESLFEIFENSAERKLGSEELRAVLLNHNVFLTDTEYETIFKKINIEGDGKCSWDDFVSYLIFGFQNDDPSNQKEALTLPISEPIVWRKSGHRAPICAISLAYDLTAENNTDNYGTYFTASKDGTIRFWTSQYEPIKMVKSSSRYLRLTPTWVLSMKALSDIRIIVVSTTERELRFYDITANNFNLRMVIRSVPHAIMSISYGFGPVSSLLMGDVAGNVKLFQFSPKLRGPFQSKPGTALIELTWLDLLKGKLPSVTVRDFVNVHVDSVRQTHYWQNHNLIFSAAECHTVSSSVSVCPGLVITDPKENTQIVFNIVKGVTTFWLDEETRVIATGGPDAYLRIWDAFVANKPTAVLSGHHAGIVYVFIQTEEQKVYSLDNSKIMKIWSLTEHTILQTYSELMRTLTRESQFACYYNRISRELIVGARTVIRIKCCPKLRLDLTDGNTHAGSVSVVLYNTLFQNIVTCGLDSYIIVWDPWTGKRQILIKQAHTVTIHAQIVDIEITAACFDPREQLLLTGARDGSLKVWNFNNAVCIRHMSIENLQEVTAVFWVPDRILATGWNMHVTEFADVHGQEYSDEKKWATLHNDDITCGALRVGQALVTGSYSGQLLLWKLETGQPYKQFDVENPTKFIKLIYNQKDARRMQPTRVRKRISLQKSLKSINAVSVRENRHSTMSVSSDESESSEDLIHPLPISIQAMLFLQVRPMSKNHGTLLVALDNGKIQVYSHHHRGGYITQFNAVHRTSDSVMSMTTDEKNKYLFTGTTFGYIKIWLIKNYCIPEEEKTPISMPKLNVRFMFLRKDRILGLAKRKVRHQKEPMLVNSFKAHTKSITSIVYIGRPKVILTGSHDCSCRLWTLGGRYLGTLGSPVPLIKMSPSTEFTEEDRFRVPPDIQKVASFTSLKVISGIYRDRIKEFSVEAELSHPMEEKNDEKFAHCPYGKPVIKPILGQHFHMPPRPQYIHQPVLDKSLPYIPVYSHLSVYDATPLERPPTPELLKKTKKLEFMEYYTNRKQTK